MAQETVRDNQQFPASKRTALEWFKLGVSLAQQGQYAEALSHFQQARNLSPNWALPYLEIAVAHLMTDNDRRQIGQALSKAVELGPEIPRGRYLYGIYLHEEGKRKQAMLEFVNALRRRPSMLDARFRLATLYVEEGQQIEGIHQFQQVLQQDPHHLGAHRNLAVLFEQSGQHELAEKHMLAIVRIKHSPFQLTNLGRFYERIGWGKKAKRAFQQARKLDPKNRRKLRPLLRSRK